MKINRLALIGIVFLIMIVALNQVNAIQQLAGPIIVKISPGETKKFLWYINSDDTVNTMSIILDARGEGSEFISFPESVQLEPGKFNAISFSVSIPKDYSETVSFRPAIYAKELVEQVGGAGVVPQVKKYVDLNIISYPEPEPVCSPGTVLKDGVCVVEEQVGGGCLIATATYGSELAPQVQFLRELRDNTVLNTESGTAFMNGFNEFYYSFSPTIADWERQSPAFKEVVKITITPLLTSLSILNYVDIGSEEEMLGYGMGVILMNIGMYFAAPAIVIFKLKRRFQS